MSGLVGIYGQTFAQRLDAIKHARGIGAFHRDLLRRDVDFVGFFLVEIISYNLQHNAVGLALVFLHIQSIAHDILDIFAEELGFTLEARFIIDNGLRLQFKGLFIIQLHLLRLRDDVVGGLGELFFSAGGKQQSRHDAQEG